MSVKTKNSIYSRLQPLRQKIQDIRGGTEVLRKKGQTYLPKFPAEDNGAYNSRLRDSVLTNFYAKTEKVMSGLVFSDSITLLDDVSPELVSLCESIDNEGNHINVFSRKVFDASFDGASVILVDAPNVQAENYQQQKDLNLTPYWTLYTADSVINWRY